MEGMYNNAGFSETTHAQGKGEVIIKNHNHEQLLISIDAAHINI